MPPFPTKNQDSFFVNTQESNHHFGALGQHGVREKVPTGFRV